MQVYANAFAVLGDTADKVCLQAIHGWLKQQIDIEIGLNELVVPNTWQGRRNEKGSWLRSYICEEEDRSLYSWRLKHGDDSVPGRQWTVEIGLTILPDQSEFSCSIQTDEQSTEVFEKVTPSRPRLIGYLLSNIDGNPNVDTDPSTPGRQIKRLGGSADEYRAFLNEIQNPDRTFPLVMVSPSRAGGYLINREHLQDQLFGLAQVVEVAEQCDSYEMEAILGRHWSAWDGAVNVIRTAHPSGRIFGNPILSDQILAQGETQHLRIAHILGKVTHNTNIPRLRMQLNPEVVLHRANRNRFQQRLDELREKTGDASSEQIDQLWEQLIEFDEKQRELLERNEQLELSLLQANEEKQALDHEIRRLKYHSRYSGVEFDKSKEDGYETGLMPSELALSLVAENAEPSPEDALELIATGYPKAVIVLPSARESAEHLVDFQHGRRLFDMLRRLVTEYRDKLKEGGDAGARGVFTPNEYAARESETVMNSPQHLASREFTYKGRKVPMLRHLKIGKADDERKTIRVHFKWDSDAEKIVIGYCGPHLPVPSH